MKRSRVDRPAAAARCFWTGLCAALLVGLAPPPASAGKHPAPPPAPTAETAGTIRLEAPVLSARGRQETLATVPRFGRYSLRVRSDQGVALQWVDPMAGPSVQDGTPGARDGRIDAFLDRGTYKLITLGHEKNTGEARLELLPFRELHESPPPLVEGRPESLTLDDLEQRSFWLELPARRQVAVQVAGRHLADLRLWQDGQWLVASEPVCQEIEPTPGRPLLDCRIVADLEPGRYLLVAYGGPSRAWGEETPDRPLYLRYGVPALPALDRRRHVMSPFGIDYFRVPKGATAFRLELPEAIPATLEAGRLMAETPYGMAGPTLAEIMKESAPPVAEVRRDGGDVDTLVRITAPAGQPYVLQYLEPTGNPYRLKGEGTLWVSTVQAGAVGDGPEATGALLCQRRDSGKPELIEARAIALDDGPWRRRFNLSGQLTMLLEAASATSIRVTAGGPLVRLRVEPVMTSRPPRYQSPPFVDRTGSFDLNPGHYLLTVQPVEQGVVDLTIGPEGVPPEQVAESPARGSLRFSPLEVDPNCRYMLQLGVPGGLAMGVITRPMPIDPADPLPLTQQPGEAVEIPVKVTSAGQIVAEQEDGSRLELSLDGTSWSRELRVTPGEHTVSIRPPEENTVGYTLRLEPPKTAPAAPSRGTPAPLPLLTTTAKQFFDLEQGASRTFLMRVDQPALYEIQTTGLLATAGNLRTRTLPSFAAARANGFGRNFLIQQYLRPGDYQLTVTAAGTTHGHLGLQLASRAPRDGGTLEPGATARAPVPAGDAVVYTLAIPKTGRYRLRSIGQGRLFRTRLEDAGGWPLAGPDLPSDFTRRLEPGRYRLVLLPEPTDTLRLTRLEALPETPEIEGHGPHPLPLAVRLTHTWKDLEGLGEKRPDVWEIDVPAPMDAGIELTGGMQAKLIRLEADGRPTEAARVSPWRSRVHLEAGRYRLEASAIRRDSDLSYTIAVWPAALADGMRQSLATPASREISVGRDGLLELATFGMTDVRLRLFTPDGRLIAANDDRPGDWNAYLLERLEAGTYRLEVAPVGRETADTAIEVRVRDEREEKPHSLPFETTLTPGGAVRLFPLEAPLGPGLLAVACRSAEYVGCALEASSGDDWRTLASVAGFEPRLAVRLAEDASAPVRYRLRVWSLDRRGSTVTVGAAALEPVPGNEAMLRRGLPLKPQPVPPVSLAVAAVDARPGLLRLEGALKQVAWCPAPNAACLEADNGQVSAAGGPLWLVAWGSERAGEVTFLGSRQRFDPGPDRRRTVRLPPDSPVALDVAAPAGGPLLVIASATEGTPGIRLVPPQATPEELARFTGWGVGRRSSLAFSSSPVPDPRALIWRAADNGRARMEARVQARLYPMPAPEATEPGRLEGRIEGATARLYRLPPGPKRLRVSLGDGLAAALAAGSEVQTVLWNDGEPLDERLETTAELLWLLGTRPGTAHFAVEITTLEGAPAGSARSLSAATGGRLELSMQTAGTLRIPIELEPDRKRPRRIHVHGAVEEAVLVARDGQVHRGLELEEPLAGGELILRHRPGLVAVWAARLGEEAAVLGDRAATAPLEVRLPASLRLNEAQATLAFRLEVPVILHVRTASPTASIFRPAEGAGTGGERTRGGERTLDGRAEEVRLHPEGTTLDLYLPAGRSTLTLRALAGGTLAGTLELTSTPVTMLSEGVGPEVLLAADAARVFAFEVKEPGPVGIGVRAVPDVLSVRVLSAAGEEKSRGITRMPVLEVGTWLLELRAPAETRPVRARPAVVGLSAPDTRPPLEVARTYAGQASDGPVQLLEPPGIPPEAAAWSQPESMREEAAPLEGVLNVDPDLQPSEGYDRGSDGDPVEGEWEGDVPPQEYPTGEGE